MQFNTLGCFKGLCTPFYKCKCIVWSKYVAFPNRVHASPHLFGPHNMKYKQLVEYVTALVECKNIEFSKPVVPHMRNPPSKIRIGCLGHYGEWLSNLVFIVKSCQELEMPAQDFLKSDLGRRFIGVMESRVYSLSCREISQILLALDTLELQVPSLENALKQQLTEHQYPHCMQDSRGL